MAASPAASGVSEGRPTTNHATRAIGVTTRAATTVARRNVRIGSPLTLTSTFQVPWMAAAASARPIARAVIRGNVTRRVRDAAPVWRRSAARAARPRQQAAEQAVHLGVDDQPVVAAP